MSIDNLQLLVKKRFLRSASLSHSPHPQQAIALPISPTSDRTPTSQNSDRTPNIPKTAIAPYIPKQRSLSPHSQQAIASHIPKSDRIPTPQTAIASPHPKQRSHFDIYSEFSFVKKLKIPQIRSLITLATDDACSGYSFARYPHIS